MAEENKSIRPIDVLNDNKEKKVLVEVIGNRMIRGILKAFDLPSNLMLMDTEELDLKGNVKKKLGTTFIKGSSIIMIISGED